MPTHPSSRKGMTWDRSRVVASSAHASCADKPRPQVRAPRADAKDEGTDASAAPTALTTPSGGFYV